MRHSGLAPPNGYGALKSPVRADIVAVQIGDHLLMDQTVTAFRPYNDRTLLPRYGYRRIQIFLAREKMTTSPDRMYRLWRRAGLQVPRKRPRHRVATSRPRPTAPESRNHVWAYDFVFDACANGQVLKCLTVVDEWTRECHAIDVAGRIRSTRVIEVLSQLISLHGAPKYLRSDNQELRGSVPNSETWNLYNVLRRGDSRTPSGIREFDEVALTRRGLATRTRTSSPTFRWENTSLSIKASQKQREKDDSEKPYRNSVDWLPDITENPHMTGQCCTPSC